MKCEVCGNTIGINTKCLCDISTGSNGPCSIDGCMQDHYAKGLCKKHYRESNKESQAKYSKRHYEDNKEKCLLRSKLSYELDKKKWNERGRKNKAIRKFINSLEY